MVPAGNPMLEFGAIKAETVTSYRMDVLIQVMDNENMLLGDEENAEREEAANQGSTSSRWEVAYGRIAEVCSECFK